MKTSDYLKLNKPELTMPRQDPFAPGPIRFHGPVLEGLIGLNHQLERQAANNHLTRSQICEIAPGGLSYLNPHLPLTTSTGSSEDPRLHRDYRTAYFVNSFPHPSYADPVLRFHMGLPPIQHPAYGAPSPAPQNPPQTAPEEKK